MKIRNIVLSGLLVGALLWAVSAHAIEGQTNAGGSGGAASSVTSGTTTITGGTNLDVCFDDAGVINCGDNGIQYTKGTGTLNATVVKLNGAIVAITGVDINTSGQVTTGAHLGAGTVPNAALVTPPVTSVTGTSPIVSSGGTTPAISSLANTTQTPTVTANAVTCNWNNGYICAFTNNAATTATFTNLPTNQYIYVEWTVNANQVSLSFGANVSSYSSNSDTIVTSPTVTSISSTLEVRKVVFWSDGTTAWMDTADSIRPANYNSINSRVYDVFGNIQYPNVEGGNTMSAFPRTSFSFDAGALATVTTATNFACFKVVKALTIENNEGVIYSDTACAGGGAVIRTYDCGASAPTNANCSGGTQLTTVSLGTTVGQVVDGTINSANVAAGEYVCAQIQAAGSCTAIDFDVTSMARPQ